MAPSKRMKKHTTTTTTTTIETITPPTDVINHIFSFLPIKSAVRFGLLSTAYRFSWNCNPNLDFGKEVVKHVPKGQREEYIAPVIDKVLTLHVGSKVRTFCLYFNPEDMQYKVDEWFAVVVSKGVEEINLDFCTTKKYFVFPTHLLLGCSSIIDLKLSHCCLSFPIGFNGLRCLKSLVLRKVQIFETAIQVVMDNCLDLEVLDMSMCLGLASLHVSATNLKKFKTFKVVKCKNVLSVIVDAPSLSSIHYYGSGVDFILLNKVPMLQDLMVGFTNEFPDYEDLLFAASQYVSTLTINTTVLMGNPFSSISFPKLKEFQLVMEGHRYSNVNRISQFLSLCPNLVKVFIDLNGFSFSNYVSAFDEYAYSFDQLKSVKLKGFKPEGPEIELVKFFLEKAPALETLVLITPRDGRLNITVEDVKRKERLFGWWGLSPSTTLIVYPNSKDRSCFQPTHKKLSE